MIYREKYGLQKSEVESVRRAILAEGIRAVIEKLLPVTDRKDASTTSSTYYRLPDGTTLRVSNHASGIWIGLTDRNNRADRIEINTGWSARRLAVKLLSIKALCE